MTWKQLLLTLCLLLPFPILGLAQFSTATLNGIVLDPNKANVVGAKVTAKNTATGQERTAESGGDGSFIITTLPPGTYDVTVEAKGFARSVRKGLVLEVGSATTANFDLKVAGVTEEVVVTGEATQVDVTRSTIEGVVNQRAIDELPLNGRSFLELSFLLPGNSIAPSFDPTKARAIEVSSLGNLGRGTNTTIDGVENNDSQIGGVSINFTQESIQEFQVVTARFAAEIGRAGFNALNVISKSGSNDFHGGGFFFLRDDALQAKGPFGGEKKPPFDREQFGGSLGGPIKHDRAFFFFAIERARENGATTAGHRDVAARQIVQSFATTPFRETLLTAKTDFRASQNDTISGRYSLQKNTSTDPGTSRGGRLQDPNNFQTQRNDFYQGVVSWTRTVSPSVVNDLRFNILWTQNSIEPLTTDPQIVFPSINVGANFRADQGNTQHRLEWKDDLSWSRGRHAFKAGADYNRLLLPQPTNFNLFGTGIINVPCDFAGDPGCPAAKSDSQIPVLFSLINRLTLAEGFPGFHKRGIFPFTGNDTLGFYFQDDFRAKPNFTLNIGLRWDYDSDIIGKNQVNRFNPGERHSEKTDFGPRIGFAWDPTNKGKTSIRGGYGLYFDHNVIETRQLEELINPERLPVVVTIGGTLANPFGQVIPIELLFVTNNKLKQPYVHQVSIGVQREVARDLVVTADYINTRGRRFQRQAEINQKKDGTLVNPNFGSVIESQTIADTAFDGLLVTVNKRFSHRMQFLGSYTLSRSINEDNDLLGFITTVSDPTNHALDRGPAPNESRHRFVFSGVFDLPGGVQLSPILTTFSSVPIEIVQNHDFSEGVGSGFTRLPGLNRNAGNRDVHSGADINKVIDAFNANAALVKAHGGPLAHVNPNIDLSHPFFTLDLRAIKRFSWKEHYSVDVGMEAFNLVNHINILGVANTNFSGIQNNVESPLFGTPLGVTPGGVFGTGGPRAFQFLTRFRF